VRGIFLLFVIMPILEMWLLIEVGSQIGALYTIGLVMLTAVIGINILRQQGFSTLNRAQSRMQQGELPGQELIEGFMLAIGGALLLTPGFITDTIGFLLLIPPTRQALVRYLIRSGQVQAWGSRGSGFTFTSFRGGSGPQSGGFYEGEFTREAPPRTSLDSPEDDPQKK
jgi:UPF0716 protein FxsA